MSCLRGLRWSSSSRLGASPSGAVTGRLIGKLGEWVMGQAIKQLKEWDRMGHSSFSIAVKLVVTRRPEFAPVMRHVAVSFESPEYTADVVATGALRLLEAIRETELRFPFDQASSSELSSRRPSARQHRFIRAAVRVRQGQRPFHHRRQAL